MVKYHGEEHYLISQNMKPEKGAAYYSHLDESEPLP